MRRLGLCGLFVGLFLVAGGCGSTSGRDPDAPANVEVPEKTYKGLSNQLCAVMVWTDWRTRVEYPDIQLFVAREVEKRLTPKPSEDKDRDKEKEKARLANAPKFVNAGSIVRFQREHPELEGQTITQFAPRLGGATRIIYIEIEQFESQSPRSILLLKGTTQATVRVVEVANGQAKVTFEELGIRAEYPPNAPEGVVPTDKVTPRTIYEGTLGLLADKVSVRFNENPEK